MRALLVACILALLGLAAPARPAAPARRSDGPGGVAAGRSGQFAGTRRKMRGNQQVVDPARVAPAGAVEAPTEA